MHELHEMNHIVDRGVEGRMSAQEGEKLKMDMARLASQVVEARMWARHGYEIGQKHCSWSDEGVAPSWLTEGYPPHIDSCDFLKAAADLDTAMARVREKCQSVRDHSGSGGMINATQILGLLSPTHPDGNYESPKSP